VDLEYPKGFPDEYQPQIEAVLAKAEHAFLTATKDVPRENVDQWELHACNYIEAVVLAFANLCADRRLIEKWLTSVSKFVFTRLPDHPDPAATFANLPFLRIKHFANKAEEHVKRSEGWLAHLEQVGADPKRLVRIKKVLYEPPEPRPHPHPASSQLNETLGRFRQDSDDPKPIPEDPADWDTPELRRSGVDQYIADVKIKTSTDINRATIWQALKYKNARSFEYWQNCDPKTSKQAQKLIIEFFRTKPHLKSTLLFIISMSS